MLSCWTSWFGTRYLQGSPAFGINRSVEIGCLHIQHYCKGKYEFGVIIFLRLIVICRHIYIDPILLQFVLSSNEFPCSEALYYVHNWWPIIQVFADAKLWHMALNVKEDMLSAGVTPNTVTWSSLISACANAGIVEKAIQLFEEMLLAGSEPNSQCFNILLHACVEANQYDRAFRLFQSLKSTKVQETFGKKYKGIAVWVELNYEHWITTMPYHFWSDVI